jgi:hypothetical protein
VEVLFHEEGDIDGSDGKEKSAPILFHLLYEGAISLREAQDQLEGQYSAAPEVCLGVLTLKTQSHPFLAGNLSGLLEILAVQGFEEIPPRLVFEEHIGFLLEGGQSLHFGLC